MIQYNKETLKNYFRTSLFALSTAFILTNTISATAAASELKKALTNFVSPACSGVAMTSLSKIGIDKWIWRKDFQIEGTKTWSAFDTTSMNWATLKAKEPGNAEINIHPSTESSQIEIVNSPCKVTIAPGLAEALKEAAKLSKKPRIYYSWSTGMILSLEGMRDLVRLAEQNSAELIFVADPKMDPTSIDSWKNKLDISNSATRPVWQSLDQQGLLARGLRRQYPSVLLEAHGKIQSIAYPGHKPLEVWQQWFKKSERELKNSLESK